MTEKAERIAKIMAASGLCSRRDAESWIEQGRVSVNGTVLNSPAFNVTADDRIIVDGAELRGKRDLRLWLYHKPAGIITTAKDPEGRKTVFASLPRKLGRVISVGRLDLNSEGLLLLTNNGEFSRFLELPRQALPRHYHVRVYGEVDANALAALAEGITVDGVDYRGIHVEQENPGSKAQNQWLSMTLHEGKNREIRNIMRALGLHVNRLIRVGYGPFELGDLLPDKVIEVPRDDVRLFCEKIGFAS